MIEPLLCLKTFQQQKEITMKKLLLIFLVFSLSSSQTFPIEKKESIDKEPSTVSSQRTKRVLVFAPHPDDDIIGCGGSIAKHKKNGHEVSVCYMTSGDSGGQLQSKEEVAQLREQEAVNAERILGVENLHFLRNPDGYLAYDAKNLIQLIELIRKEQPDIVYIPHRADAHKDHIATHELVVEAAKRAGWRNFHKCKWPSWKVTTILCYEVWTPLQEVSYCEDISEFMDLKLEALRHHASQLADMKYDSAVEGLNLFRGSMTRTGKYGEGFQVLKISFDDISTIVQN
jgi:LmbE family N-acetylglucosaminyl deacetylase